MNDTASAATQPGGPPIAPGGRPIAPGAGQRPAAGRRSWRVQAVIGLGILLIAAIAGLTLSVMLAVRSREISEAERDLGQLDVVLAEQTDRTIQAVDLILQGEIAELRAAGIATPEAFRQEATNEATFRDLNTRVVGVPQLDAVTLISTDGDLLNFSRYYPIPHVNVADRDYFRALSSSAGREFFLSGPVENRGSGTLNIYLARRFSGPDGKFIGLALGAMQVGYFQRFYDELQISTGTAIALRRSDGLVLAARGATPASAALRPSDGAEVVGAAGPGTAARIVVTRTLQDYPVKIEISQLLDEVLVDWRYDAGAIGLGGLASAGAVALMIWALLRQFRAYDAVTGALAARDAAELRRGEAEEQLRQAQKMEAVGQLTAGLAHDFNNLLMSISGCLEGIEPLITAGELAGRIEAGELARRIGVIRQAAERGGMLTRQLLAFSRKQILQPRAVDLNAVLRDTNELLQGTLGGTVRVSLRLRPDLWPALVDPAQLEHAVLNLVINARDAMPGGGFIAIETENVTLAAPDCPDGMQPGDYVRIAVIDSGTGMPPEVAARAFDPFFTTKPQGSGSGLGLSQAYGFARQSGGGIRIESEPGRGSTIWLWLPRAGEAATTEIAGPGAATAVPEGYVPADAVVLLVDDDAAVRDTIAGILDQAGFQVLAAPDGPAALLQLDTVGTIDLLVADYGMPGMNGVELARHVRARQPGLPVILVTGYADAGPLEGEKYLLQKPFRGPELIAMASAALWQARHG